MIDQPIPWRRISSLVSALLFASFAAAAPYPKEGLPTEWRQPDGTVLSLRVHGDEFYGRTTTEDGYTVLFNDADKTYYYATKEAAGKTLVPTAVSADKAAPAGLEKELRDAPAKISEVRQANIQKYVPERENEWRTKMEQPAAVPVVGAKVGLTILVQFPDVTFPVSQTKMERFCNEVGYSDDGNTGSIRDYFHDQSLGQLTHTQSVTAVVTMPNPRNYYNFANYPTNSILRDAGDAGRLLVQHAITRLASDGFDFSALSTDGSNRVLATSLLFAGADSGVWAKGLWPHAWNLANGGMNAGGKTIYRYQCTNVPDTSPVIGTIIHELGHLLLGYPDLYDTDSFDGDSEGLGEHCLMGSANYLNGGRTPAPINLYLKSVSGWANITDFTESQSLNLTLPSTGNVGYRIRKPGTATEYFLIENRGDGDKWAAHCKDKGLAIWHIDEAVNSDNMRQQMTSSQHYMVSIEQADGRFDLERANNRGDSTDFFDSTTGEFDDYSNPNANWWNGFDSGLYVKPLSAPGASMEIQVGAPAGVTTLGINPGSLLIPSNAVTQTISVNSNSEWTWSGNPTWITTTEAPSQQGRQSFEYNVANNPTTESRTAILTFTAGTVTRTHTVTQLGKIVDDHGNATNRATLIGLNSINSGNIEKAGDADYFRLEANGPGTLTIRTISEIDTVGTLYDSAGQPLTTNDDTNGLDFQVQHTFTGAMVFYVRVNHYYSSQTGQYMLESSFVPSGALSVLAESQNVPNGGGTYTFEVATALPTTNWRCYQDDGTWASTNLAQQTGSKTVSYTVPANSGAPRTMKIRVQTTVHNATHTIRQAGAPRPDLVDADENTQISPSKLISAGKVRVKAGVRNIGTVDSGPFTIKFQVSYNLTIHATDDPTVGTLTVPGLAAGETYPFDFMGTLPVLASSRPDWWVAWHIDANDQVLEESETNNKVVTSSPMPRAEPDLTINPSTRSVDGVEGTHTIEATANSSWTWSSNAAWLTSSAPTNQIESQILPYFVTANPTTALRTGVITLTSGSVIRTHTVTQGAKPIPFEFTSFQVSGNNVGMTFKSELGKTYRVVTSTSLLSNSWETVPGQTGIVGTGAPILRNLLDMGLPPAGGKRFFRVEKE